MHPDIPDEQAYFDRALGRRDRLEANRPPTVGSAADPETVSELRRRAGALGVIDPAAGVAFGRIDFQGQRLYIGKRAIWDEENELLVVNWQAPLAAPFYTATREDPQGLDARRVYHCQDNQILEIDETVFSGITAAAAEQRAPSDPTMSDPLLDSLERARSGERRDVVATIQAAQYGIITRDSEQLLVVQGGPGTGTTVVGLHRASWILHNRRDRWHTNDVLIVGPSDAYIRYISGMLASRDEALAQLPVSALGPQVPLGRVDPVDVRRLKGDRRMLRLMLRAVRHRQRPERGPIDVGVAGRTVRLDGDRIVRRARQLSGRPHNDAGRELRDFVIDEVQQFFSRRGLRGLSAVEDVAPGEATREIDRYMDRIWPVLSPTGFLVDLFSTRRNLETAGAGLLTGEEMAMLSLPSAASASEWGWSADDVPLLDLIDALLNGTPHTYEYIVVDEAQNLSPMQLESIRRRSRRGWLTVLGDLAQATGPWVPESWDDVVLHLRSDRVPIEIAELSLGYRLPKEIHDVAVRLLPEIAPRLTAPEALRSSGHDVVVQAHRPGDLSSGVAEAVAALLDTGSIGVLSAASHRSDVTEALDAEGLTWASEFQATTTAIVVLGVEDATGLEFDNVVVVEPARIVHESPHGARALFVALTRATQRLIVVHAEALPEVLELCGSVSPEAASASADPWEPVATAAPQGPSPADDPPLGWERDAEAGSRTMLAGPTANGASSQRGPLSGLDRAMARAVATELAETLARHVQPALLPLVVEEMRHVLDIERAGAVDREQARASGETSD